MDYLSVLIFVFGCFALILTVSYSVLFLSTYIVGNKITPNDCGIYAYVYIYIYVCAAVVCRNLFLDVYIRMLCPSKRCDVRVIRYSSKYSMCLPRISDRMRLTESMPSAIGTMKMMRVPLPRK